MTAATMVEGAGERKLRENRKRLMRLIYGGLAVGLGSGVAIGFFSSTARQEGWPAWPIWAALAVTLVALTWYTAVYLRRIDELDLLDNLWASFVGFNVLSGALLVWMVLHKDGQAPAPHALSLWGISLAAAGLAYGWRKLRGRF